MIKSSFAVGYQLNSKTVNVLGVTSIVPNLNGVLFFTEDGENHFIESHEMNEVLGNMFIDYDQSECTYGATEILDHRKK